MHVHLPYAHLGISMLMIPAMELAENDEGKNDNLHSGYPLHEESSCFYAELSADRVLHMPVRRSESGRRLGVSWAWAAPWGLQQSWLLRSWFRVKHVHIWILGSLNGKCLRPGAGRMYGEPLRLPHRRRSLKKMVAGMHIQTTES